MTFHRLAQGGTAKRVITRTSFSTEGEIPLSNKKHTAHFHLTVDDWVDVDSHVAASLVCLLASLVFSCVCVGYPVWSQPSKLTTPFSSQVRTNVKNNYAMGANKQQDTKSQKQRENALREDLCGGRM